MEKVGYLVNFLEEYLVGKHLASVDARLLQTFLKSSKEAMQTVQNELASYHSTIPQHNERFLGFVSAMNEFAERENGILKVLQRAESEHYLSIEDSLKINPEEFGMEGQPEGEMRRESNLSTEDCMINIQTLSKVLARDMSEYDRIYEEFMESRGSGGPNNPADDSTGIPGPSNQLRKSERLSASISARILRFLTSYEDSLSKYQECSRGKLSKEVRAELEEVADYLTKTIGSDFYVERLNKIKMLLLDIKRKTTEVVEIAEVVYLAQKVSSKMRNLERTGASRNELGGMRNDHRITFDESSLRLPDSSQTKRSYTQREDKLSSGGFGVKSSFLLAANEWGLTPVQRKTFMHLVQHKFATPVPDSVNEEFTIKEMIANIKNINPELDIEAGSTQQADDYYEYFPHEKPLKQGSRQPNGPRQPTRKMNDTSDRGSNAGYFHDAMKEGFDPNMQTQTTINQSGDLEQEESQFEGDGDRLTKYTKMLDTEDSPRRKKKCCEGCNLI